MGHIAVLANPSAGKGRGEHATEAAVASLRGDGTDVRVFSGASAAETARLAAMAIADGPDVLVVVGGDGTVSGILDLVCASEIPLALVPAGTGNDLARALGLPLHDPAEAALLARRGTVRRIDVGEIDDGGTVSLFLTVAALGFDAKVSERTNRLRWPHGAARYYLALLIELVRLRPMDFVLSAADGTEEAAPGTLVAIGNTATYGGGMPICAGALADDGLLDVVAVGTLSRHRLVRLFPLLLTGRHLTRPEVRHRRTAAVTVRAPGLVVYADGERRGAGACTIRVRRAAMAVLTPADGDIT